MSAVSMGEAIRLAIGKSRRRGRTPDGRIVPCITFRDYMSLCLYHPEFGYYRSGASRVGRDGDFYTSAYIGEMMGELLAERLVDLASARWPGGQTVEVVDWGGGTGRLAAQMLAAWQRMGEAGERFRLTVADGNPAHLRQAREALASGIDAGRARVVPAVEAEREAWEGRPTIVVGNELLDAFPVHRVCVEKGGLREWGVAWDESDAKPVSCLLEPTDPRLAQWLEHQGVRLAESQTTEIGLDGADWTAWLAGRVGEAMLVVIDYGDSTRELTGSHRMDGTLLCYERHQAHADPFRHPGGQDMTAHVDFDLVRACAMEAGWNEVWYGTQKRFLVESGIMSKLTEHGIRDPFHPVVRRNRAIRQLLLSDGMSELFKVQIWAKE